jgi:hypothetical protein
VNKFRSTNIYDAIILHEYGDISNLVTIEYLENDSHDRVLAEIPKFLGTLYIKVCTDKLTSMADPYKELLFPKPNTRLLTRYNCKRRTEETYELKALPAPFSNFTLSNCCFLSRNEALICGDDGPPTASTYIYNFTTDILRMKPDMH